MTITRDEILTVVNDDLLRGRTEATLAPYLRRAIDDLSGRATWPDLHTSADTAIVADDTDIADPTDIRVLDKITVNDGTNDSKPLKVMTWDEYKIAVADGDASTDEPDRYCRHGGRIYLYPTANASFTVTVWYWKHHPDPTSNAIEFGDQFRAAVEYGTEMFLLAGFGLDPDPKYPHVAGQYIAAVGKLLPEADSQPRFAKYGGI